MLQFAAGCPVQLCTPEKRHFTRDSAACAIWTRLHCHISHHRHAALRSGRDVGREVQVRPADSERLHVPCTCSIILAVEVPHKKRFAVVLEHGCPFIRRLVPAMLIIVLLLSFVNLFLQLLLSIYHIVILIYIRRLIPVMAWFERKCVNR